MSGWILLPLSATAAPEASEAAPATSPATSPALTVETPPEAASSPGSRALAAVSVSVLVPRDDEPLWLGAAGEIGLWLSPSWSIGLDLAAGGGPLRVEAAPLVRLWMPRDADGPRLSLGVGGGVALDAGPAPLLLSSLTADFSPGRRWQPRVGLRGSWSPALGGDGPTRSTGGVALELGAAWNTRSEAAISPEPVAVDPAGGPAEPVAAVAPAPAEPATTPTPDPVPPMVTTPAAAKVWVPHPWCEWMSAEDANKLLATLPAETRVEVSAAGYLPASVGPGAGAVVLTPAPEQGAMVIVARVGDQVRVDGVPVSVDAEGLAVVNAGVGDHPIEVLGGGRRESLEASIASGYVVWLRAGEPAPARVRFASGSATVSATEAAGVDRLAANVGAWGFQVQGGASPEGNPEANAVLAVSRANAVRDRLIAAGVAADRVVLLPPAAPIEGLNPADQRAVTITPVPRATP